MDMDRIDFAATAAPPRSGRCVNADDSPHNFHVHDVQFQILTSTAHRHRRQLAGWKDTVYLPPRACRSGSPLRFTDYTDPAMPYMYHCHLLLHEDQGMMGQFLVVEPGQKPAPMAMDMDMSHQGHGG